MPHDCDKEQILEFMVEGQKAIFSKLDKINDSISVIAAQNIRISNLETRVDGIEQTHKREQTKSLTQKTLEAIVIAVAVSLTVAGTWGLVRAIHGNYDQQQERGK